MILELTKEQEIIFNELSKKKNCSINDVLDSMLNEYLEQIHNEETEKVIKEASNGINLSKTFNSVKELMEDLNAVD